MLFKTTEDESTVLIKISTQVCKYIQQYWYRHQTPFLLIKIVQDFLFLILLWLI